MGSQDKFGGCEMIDGVEKKKKKFAAQIYDFLLFSNLCFLGILLDNFISLGLECDKGPQLDPICGSPAQRGNTLIGCLEQGRRSAGGQTPDL